MAQPKTPPDRAVCFRPHGDCRSDFIRRVQAADRHPPWCDRGTVNAYQPSTSLENAFGTSNGLTGRPSKAPRLVLPTTRWKVRRRRLARGRTAGALHGWCVQRQLIDLLPLDSRFSGAAGQSWQQHSLHRVAPIVVKHGHAMALRLFVSTRSLAASFVRPWTVRTDRTRATDLSGEKVTKQDSPGPQRGESRRRLPWARVTNIRGPRRSQCSSCHSKRWQASCAACT